MSVFILSDILSKVFLIIRRIQRDIINIHMFSCKLLVTLVRFD
jgi:hypothetical protein